MQTGVAQNNNNKTRTPAETSECVVFVFSCRLERGSGHSKGATKVRKIGVGGDHDDDDDDDEFGSTPVFAVILANPVQQSLQIPL